MGKLSQILQKLVEIPVRAGRHSKLQERLNDMQDAIHALARCENLASGKYIQIRQIASDKVSITGTPGGGGSSAEDHPWRPLTSSDGKIRIKPGNIGGSVIPEDWNSEIEITQTTDVGAIWLEVDINEDGRATSARYINSATVPLIAAPSGYDQLPPKLYYFLFGYKSSGGTISNFYIAAKKNIEVITTVSGSVYAATYRDVYLREVD